MSNFITRICCRNNLGNHLNFAKRCFSVGTCQRGFEEFFPPGVYEGKNYVEEEPVVGRRWKISELRIRSNTDLHKFWYVLLKEKNMLLTLDQECKRLGVFVPGPTRLHKVEQTMDLVERVIKERQQAIMKLENERKYKFDEEEENENFLHFNDKDFSSEQSVQDLHESVNKEHSANTI